MTRDEILKLEPGPALDARVAELVMGMERLPRDVGVPGMPVVRWLNNKRQYIDGSPPPFSREMGSAWDVVEAVLERKDPDGHNRWYFQLRDQAMPETPWVAAFVYRGDRKPSEMVYAEARGYTAPRAICFAALLAVSQ